MDSVKFIAISGTTGVTENLYVYEYGNDIIITDCGVGFPEESSFGVDLVIPDFSYVLQNKNKIRAVFVSHGHEDHFGALPFLLRELQVPVYATKLVVGFIKDKLGEYKVRGELRTLEPDKNEGVKVGVFTVDCFRVTHSVPDSVGFCITTPVGKFFHVPDYKFDWTPVDQKPFDIAKAALLAKDGVVALASDCLGATSEDYTKSEIDIEKNIELLIEKASQRVIFTTLSSNISRMQQAIRASSRLGRKVVLIGRSVETKAEIAKNLGYLNWGGGVVIGYKDARKLPKNKLTYIVSGSYGQVGSSLYRIATDEHDVLSVEAGDVVIFSADPNPPGTQQSVNYIVDNLIESGAKVHYYDTQEDLHVSGHGSQKDMEMLMALVRPKYLIPIGGTIRHMRHYSELANSMGWKNENVFELRPGAVLEFNRDGVKRGKAVPSRTVFVDGLGIGDVGNVVLRDRKSLAQEGIVVAVIQIDSSNGQIIETPDLISRGFVFHKEHQGMLNQAAKELVGTLKKRAGRHDAHPTKEITIDFLERYFFDKTGRRPMILPVVVEV